MILVAVALLWAATPVLLAQDTVPRFTTVEPMEGKAGDMITANGENVGKTTVAELYLTDGKNDVKVTMSEQTDTVVKFAIPKTVKPGRYRLMVLTRGKEPKLIEQPVRVEVLEPQT
jgi:hypothetical protein